MIIRTKGRLNRYNANGARNSFRRSVHFPRAFTCFPMSSEPHTNSCFKTTLRNPRKPIFKSTFLRNEFRAPAAPIAWFRQKRNGTVRRKFTLLLVGFYLAIQSVVMAADAYEERNTRYQEIFRQLEEQIQNDYQKALRGEKVVYDNESWDLLVREKFRNDGVAKAKADIAAGKLLLFKLEGLAASAPSPSKPRHGGIYVSARFGVEIIGTGCIPVTEPWELGYNEVVEQHLKQKFGGTVMDDLGKEIYPRVVESIPNPFAFSKIIPPSAQIILGLLLGILAFSVARHRKQIISGPDSIGT